MKGFLKGASLAMSASVLAVSAFGAPAGHPAQMIHGSIDETQRVVLGGNTRSEAKAANDLGAVADSMPMPSMLMQLKPSPERQAALKQYIDELHDPRSANFHQWLTPAQFAEHYGVAQADVDIVAAWLRTKGFTVSGIAPTGLQIEFSGTAGTVRSAFNTTIHRLSVRGENHIANFSDPQIPAALHAAVEGVISLHDFRPQPHNVRRGPAVASKAHPAGTEASGFHYVGAPDLATIYNLKPLFDAGYSGRGQSIMVVEDTYLYTTADFTTFRKTFGLSRPYPYGTLTQVAPAGAISCVSPGYAANGDDGEAAIDVEWASAAAPNAAIILAACKDTMAFGGLIALQNTLNGPVASLPSVVSISYGESEAQNGAAANASYNVTYQQAVSEGVSIFVSSGDELAESADGGAIATHGIGVSGFASTPYNVAVGGTDFGYNPLGDDPAKYWAATNSNTYGSALSYMTEVPWNGSCASALVASYYGPSVGVSTPQAFCNSAAVNTSTNSYSFFSGAFGGSGGPSGCATGVPSTRSVVSGTCAGYAKPSWQTGIVGNPADGVRDIPDVSLFASNGIFDPYYAVCWSNPSTSATEGGGYTCTGDPSTWAGFGGTSVSAPIMAAIQALVNQKTGSRWGNPNVQYYALANAEYGAAGSSTCNSSTVNKTSNSCKFYDITQGDIVGECKGARNCYVDPAQAPYAAGKAINGLSSTTVFPTKTLAYPTTTGWDFGTGIGSVNAYNLVMGWPALTALAVSN